MFKAINWLGTIEKLSCVRRFSQCHLTKSENVLEHSGAVALISLQIATLLREEGYCVDVEKVLIKALIHDSEESVIGDISKPSKYSSLEIRKLFGDYENNVAENIFTSSGMLGVYPDWKDAKGGREGSIVAFVDTLTAILRFHDEIVMRGNRTMIELLSPTAFATLVDKLKVVEDYFQNAHVVAEYFDYCRMLKEQMGRAMK